MNEMQLYLASVFYLAVGFALGYAWGRLASGRQQ